MAADPAREFAFATEEGGREGVEWRYRLEPSGAGTVVTESYVVSWIPAWARIVDVPTNRVRELRDGMRHTLEQLKRVAETTPTASLTTFVPRSEEFPVMHTYKAAPDVDVVTSTATIAGFGQLAINAFVIHADEPVLVDTGSVVESDDFMTALRRSSIRRTSAGSG